MQQSTVARLLLSAALTLPLAACSTLIPGAPSKGVLDGLPLVENSDQSPCWQQRQIAMQHSFIDAAKGAKGAAYKGPCDWAPKVKPSQPMPGSPDKATS